MPNGNSDQEGVTIVDGSLDFSAGVNSYLTPTVASDRNPNGLKRNQLAWLNNATVRGGGITQRPAWQKIGDYPAGASGVYQGKFIYEPDSELPYQIVAVGGDIWKMDVDDPSSAINLSSEFQTPVHNLITPTGQITVTLQRTAGATALTIQPSGTDATIGDYYNFVIPAPLGSVNVPVMVPYTEALGGSITIGGITYTIVSSNGFLVSTSQSGRVTLPSALARYYFCQAEQFLVIQAGDLKTLPLIWDGNTLRRSLGLYGNGLDLPGSGAAAGTVVANTPAGASITLPAAFGGSLTVALDRPYTGATGDYLLWTIPSSTVIPAGITWSTMLLLGVVTAIGANNVTIAVLDKYPSFTWGSTIISVAWSVVLPYIVSPSAQNVNTVPDGTPEIPPATAMDYFMGRLWYAQGRKYSAGDIVGNQSSGTAAYDFRDSVLKITENPLAVGGDGFTVPTNAGNIRAIKHSANINTTLGEGQLYIFTRRSVYSLSVPVTRTDWIGADTNNSPRQTVVQITNGSVNDRSIVEQNGDLFFQSFEPSIRSLVLAMRYYEQWGNTPISINENRILKFNDRGLMQFSAGVGFDNRVLELVLPELSPFGVIHRGVVPLNFDVVSTLETKLPPVWEGAWEGLSFLELAAGDFGGRQRCFATIYSDKENNLQLWEISNADRFEKGDNRVEWFIEFPAFTWGNEFEMKKLVSAEIWIDRLFGEVMFQMEYRPDGDACWYKWHTWKQCTARTSCEDVRNPNCTYPTDYCESFRETMILPKPPASCVRPSGRPSNYGFQFQPRLIIKGFCRVRGLLLKAERVQQQLYGKDLVC